MQVASVWRALRHRNFRRFFAGQALSLIGTWMQQTALAWLIYAKTDSPGWLGVVGFAAQIPTFFLAPIAGVYVDRWNRHRLIIATQTLAMLQAIAITALAFADAITVERVICLNLFLGVIYAFDIPARQAFLFDLVGASEDLSNAIALNSSMVNGARLIGPALAGLMLLQSSPAVCFLINALSYLAVLASLLAIRLPPARLNSTPPRHMLTDLAEGFGYAFRFRPVRALLLLAMTISFLGSSYSVLMPVFAQEILRGDSDTYGFLNSAAGSGALLAATLLASRKNIAGLGEWIALAPALLGMGLIGLSFSQMFWLSLLIVMVNGFAVMTHMAASNTVLQSIVDENKRGRVMSLYTVAFMGTLPLGSLTSGFVASQLGPAITVRICGVCCILCALVFFARLHKIREMIHPMRVERIETSG